MIRSEAGFISAAVRCPQDARILGVYDHSRSALKVESDNEADPTKATAVFIEVLG